MVLRSTVYPGTTEYVTQHLQEAGCAVDVAFCPERIAEGFLRWYADGPPDVGVQTRAVLAETRHRGGPAALTMRAVSADLHERTGRTAGNGSLMRTGPVALAHLHDVDALVGPLARRAP